MQASEPIANFDVRGVIEVSEYVEDFIVVAIDTDGAVVAIGGVIMVSERIVSNSDFTVGFDGAAVVVGGVILVSEIVVTKGDGTLGFDIAADVVGGVILVSERATTNGDGTLGFAVAAAAAVIVGVSVGVMDDPDAELDVADVEVEAFDPAKSILQQLKHLE